MKNQTSNAWVWTQLKQSDGFQTSRKWLKSQLRSRISSGGKSLVPLGGLTSILCCSSVSGGGGGERAPDRLPSRTGCADATAQKFLWFRRGLGKQSLREERVEGDKNRGLIYKLKEEWRAGIVWAESVTCSILEKKIVWFAVNQVLLGLSTFF